MPDRFAPYMDPADVARARRAASKRGWRVEKSRDRIHANNRGLLRLIDPWSIPISWAALSTRRPRTSSTTAGTIPLARRGPRMRESLLNPK